MKVYRVKDWDKNFENNKSRERDNCSFVCIPNKQHGFGFIRLISLPDGDRYYGIWHFLVGYCSRQTKPRGGWLTQDGHQTGTPLAPADMCVMWRRDIDVVKSALAALCEIGWLEIVEMEGAESESDIKQVPVKCPSSARQVPLNRIEEKRREENIAIAIGAQDAPAHAPAIKFKKPSIEEIKLQGAKIGLPDSECSKFFHHYEANGWHVGKNPMKSWPAAMINWRSNFQNRIYENSNRGGQQNTRNEYIATSGEARQAQIDSARRIAERTQREAEALQVSRAARNPVAAQGAPVGTDAPKGADHGRCG